MGGVVGSGGWGGGVLRLDCWNFWRVAGGGMRIGFSHANWGRDRLLHTGLAAEAAVKHLKLCLLSHSQLS